MAVSHLCETCRACPAAAACVQRASRFLNAQPDSPLMQRERLRITVVRQALASTPPAGGEGQGAPALKPGRLALTATQQETVARLPSQVATAAKKLFERGWFAFAHREMLAGRNPGRDGWQRILCRHLIGDGVSRRDLQMEYQQTLHMTPGSAKVRVCKAVSLFAAGGLVVEFDNRLQLRRN